MSGVKNDGTKRDYSLLPFKALGPVVDVLEFGAKKYARDNWQKVEPATRYWKALLRHVVDYSAGEAIDPESGKSHLAHIATNALFCVWFELMGRLSPEIIARDAGPLAQLPIRPQPSAQLPALPLAEAKGTATDTKVFELSAGSLARIESLFQEAGSRAAPTQAAALPPAETVADMRHRILRMAQEDADLPTRCKHDLGWSDCWDCGGDSP